MSVRKRALNKDDKSPKADRWRTKVRQGRLSTIRNRNITIVERIRRIPTLLTASQHISILRSWRFYNTLAVQNACSCVFSQVLILSPVLPERVARRENGLCLLSFRQNKRSSFPGHAPGKDTLRAANAATKVGANGGKREGERSERESVVPRQNKDSRRVGGHAPPQRHLERSERDDENEVYGEKTE